MFLVWALSLDVKHHGTPGTIGPKLATRACPSYLKAAWRGHAWYCAEHAPGKTIGVAATGLIDGGTVAVQGVIAYTTNEHVIAWEPLMPSLPQRASTMAPPMIASLPSKRKRKASAVRTPKYA
jgi:hypothetical protein